MTVSDSPPIQKLPDHLINQIKAGEVVERPSSLVKEILENSLDAGATKIHLSLVDNGMSLIHLSDNGTGMSFEDLPQAFARHTTSKIGRFEDLYSLDSYGFRGEALASIAAVARIECQSVQKSTQKGGIIQLEGGEIESHLPIEGEYGTRLTIKDLFFNTPVRLKFIKSKQSERYALQKILTSFLVNYPQVEFRIQWDQEEKLFFRPCSKEERVTQILAGKQKNKFQWFHHQFEYEGHQIEVFLSKETFKGASSRRQILITNGRLFYDRSFHQCLVNSLRPLWDQSQQGHYAVFFNVPKKFLDANVHPNKIKLKFLKEDIIFGLIRSTMDQIVAPFKELPKTHEIGGSENSNIDEGKTPSPSLPSGGLDPILDFPDFYLFKDGNNLYQVEKHKFWQHFFQGLDPKDINTVPLLIGEAANAPNEIEAEVLVQLQQNTGIDIEYQGNNLYVLKEVPEILLDQNFYLFFRELLKNADDLSLDSIASLAVNSLDIKLLAQRSGGMIPLFFQFTRPKEIRLESLRSLV